VFYSRSALGSVACRGAPGHARALHRAGWLREALPGSGHCGGRLAMRSDSGGESLKHY